jgi:hypothetical protein
VKRWRDNGVDWLGRYYVNAVDNTTLFSAFVSVPHAGVVIEIVTAHVDVDYQVRVRGGGVVAAVVDRRGSRS